MKPNGSLLTIDGSAGEGGGQILDVRFAVEEEGERRVLVRVIG
jgi:hypothetical protein